MFIECFKEIESGCSVCVGRCGSLSEGVGGKDKNTENTEVQAEVGFCKDRVGSVTKSLGKQGSCLLLTVSPVMVISIFFFF